MKRCSCQYPKIISIIIEIILLKCIPHWLYLHTPTMDPPPPMKVFTIPRLLSQTPGTITTPEIIDDIILQAMNGQPRYINRYKTTTARPYKNPAMTVTYYQQPAMRQLLHTFKDRGVRILLRHDVMKYIKSLTSTPGVLMTPVSILICDKQSTLEYNTITQCTRFQQLHTPIATNILAYIRQTAPVG